MAGTGITICGMGSYLPDNFVDNNAYAQIVDTSDEWIRPRTGIVTRPIANGETTWRMGAAAGRRALERAGVDPKEVDLILVTSVTPDLLTPSMSCVIQQELGCPDAMCIDANCASTGFVYGLDMARRYLYSGDVDTVLLISTEMLSRITNYADRSTCVLFGDGAGAAVVRRGEGLYGAHLGADGTGYGLMFCRLPLPASPFTHNPPQPDEIYGRPEPDEQLVMAGHEVYKFAVKAMPQAVEKACAKAGLAPSELKWVVPHQANIRIIQTAMKNLGLPMEQAWVSIDHTGNMSSATIPIALDEMVQAGALQRGDKVVMVGFGAGLTYGAAVIEW